MLDDDNFYIKVVSKTKTSNIYNLIDVNLNNDEDKDSIMVLDVEINHEIEDY